MLLHLNEIDPLPKLGAKVEPKPAPVIAAAKSYEWRCVMASDLPKVKPSRYWYGSPMATYMYEEFGCF